MEQRRREQQRDNARLMIQQMISTGALANIPDAELQNWAAQSGYTFDSLKAVRDAVKKNDDLKLQKTLQQMEIQAQNYDLARQRLDLQLQNAELKNNKNPKFYDKNGNELTPIQAAQAIVSSNPNASEDELFIAIRQNVPQLDIADITRIIKIASSQKPPLSIDEVKQKIVNVLTPAKELYSREEAKYLAETQLKKSLGLSTNQELPQAYKDAIDQAITQVYGQTFLQKVGQSIRGTLPF
jgi:hypothetical protein